MVKKKGKDYPEIRIGKPSKKAYETVVKLAKDQDRTVAWIANHIIELYADQIKN